MKRMITLLLALCLCVGLCACANNSRPTETEPHSDSQPTDTVPKQVVSEEQAYAVQRSAQMHAYIDYGYSFDSVSYLSVEDDGTYVTIEGEVVFADDANNKFHGNYTVVLIEKDDSESPYKVVSWEVDSLVAVIDESRDYFAELYDYVVENGYYDSNDKCSYIEEMYVRNEYFYLIAEDDTLIFWDFAHYEGGGSEFTYSYRCTFSKDAEPFFELKYLDYEVSGDTIVGGIVANATGHIDALGKKIVLPLLSEKCVNCDIEDYYKYIYDGQGRCKEFVGSILSDAKLGITFEQLFG